MINRRNRVISVAKNWCEDEGSFIRNITFLNSKIKLAFGLLIKDKFGKVDQRIYENKERDLAVEKFLIEVKNNQKKYLKEYKESKLWTEFFYDEEYLPKVQKMNDFLNLLWPSLNR